VTAVDEDYNAATVRATVRLFLGTYSAFKAWEVVTQKLLGRTVAQYVYTD